MNKIGIKENTYCLFLFSWGIHNSVLKHINKNKSLFNCISWKLATCVKEGDGRAWEEFPEDLCVGKSLNLELPGYSLDADVEVVHWAEGACFVHFLHMCFISILKAGLENRTNRCFQLQEKRLPCGRKKTEHIRLKTGRDGRKLL